MEKMQFTEFLLYLKFIIVSKHLRLLMSLQKVRISCQHPAENLQIKLLMCLTQQPIFSTTILLILTMSTATVDNLAMFNYRHNSKILIQ